MRGNGYESLEGRMGDLQVAEEEEPNTHGRQILAKYSYIVFKTHIDEKDNELRNIWFLNATAV